MRNEEKLWLLSDSRGYESGPFTFAQLQERYAAHEINGDVLCMPKGFLAASGWKPLSNYFPDFKGGDVSHIAVSVQPQGSTTLATEFIERRSGWATFLRVVGCVNILVGLIGFVASDDKRLGGILLAIGLVGVIQSFLFAFLVDVFTDIRWFVKKIADERSPDA